MKLTSKLIILVFLPWLSLANGPLLPKIINFDKEDYQAHNQNWGLTQASSHIMYFANNNGLLEFDGLSWQSHLLPEKQIARSVASDSMGRIYTGGYREFGYWTRDELGKLEYTSISANQLQGEALREEFWHIQVTDNAVYFQSFSSLYQWKDEQLKRLSPPGNIMFVSQVGQRLIVPVIRGGLYELLDDGSFQLIGGGDIFQDKIISCILPWRDQFLVGTAKSGLFVFDGLSFSPWQVEVNPLLQTYQLNKGVFLQNGQYAFGTILEGLFVVDPKGRLLFHFNQENGLQNNTILSLFQDHRSNLWLGLDSGISLIPLGQPLLFYEDLKGIIGSVYAAEIYGKKLFIGTNRGLFYRSWPLRKEDDFQLVPGMQGQTWDLLSIDDELLCGHNEGTFRIAADGSVEQLSQVTGGWKFCTSPEAPDRLIIGTYTGLVLLIRDQATAKWQFRDRVNGFGFPVQNLKKAPGDNRFWAIVPNEGVFQLVLNEAMDSVVTYTHYTEKLGLSAEYRVDLQIVGAKVLVQTDGSTYVYQPEENVFKQISEKQKEYPNQAGKRIWIDEKNMLVLQDHFVQFIHAELDSVKLPIRLIPEYEMVKKINDSLILFGLDEGFAVLNAKKISHETHSPAPYLKGISFSGRKKGDALIRLNNEGFWEVEAGANDVRFEFSNPVFIHPVRVRYRLLPFQKEWSGWSSVFYKTFTNLPPGEYSLELQSNTSPHIYSKRFFLKPYWYQTNWVLIPYILLIGLVIFLLNRWQKKRLLRQQKKMLLQKEKQFHQERIQLRNEQLQKNILSKSRELANSTFNIIRKNEILITIKEELKKIKSDRNNGQQKNLHQKVIRLIDRHLDHHHDWEVFEENFNEVHEVFLKKLIKQYPELTPGDLKLAAYLRMNLSSKEIAPLLNISIRGVENKRYRLRKKLDLPAEENLTEFMINF